MVSVVVLLAVSYFVFSPVHLQPEPAPVEKTEPAPDAAPAAGDMVDVPAGKFFMGCNEEVDR